VISWVNNRHALDFEGANGWEIALRKTASKQRGPMAEERAATKTFIVGKYVCPETDQVIPVNSAVPMSELDCPVIVKVCPSCGERHEVCCDDLLEPDDSELE
jgi:hypothetical protein